MCGSCGCGSGAVITLLADRPVPAWLGGRVQPRPDHSHRHPPGHGHHSLGQVRALDEARHHGESHALSDHDHPDALSGHDHDHPHAPSDHDHPHALHPADSDRTIEIQQKVLAKNDDLAEQNRDWLRERGILAINLMSSPGSGKTTLLERTARELAGRMTISVIEGDQETALDARRIQAAGSRVVQINTGVGCHLDAEMVAHGLRGLDPPSGSIVVIENVGNLVCPALFDLGEEAKVVLASVTEGADKPLKYPHMFRQADLVLLNKTDLLPYVDFDIKQYMTDLRMAAPDALLLQMSATTGDGIEGWYDWLRRRVPAPHD
jgi:hydrogenase nickel incorporation protein HypB